MIHLEDPLIFCYKKSEPYQNLKLYITRPKIPSIHCPAIIFFHGAGFTNNKVTPRQFQQHALHFASLGMVTILAEYRPLEVEGRFSPMDSIMNAKSAIRWTRENARDLGVHPNKVVAAGASAGGYLCLCAAMIDQCNDPGDNERISAQPDALIIFNGGVDTKMLIDLFPALEEPLLAASPVTKVKANLPPSLFFHGTDDVNIPIQEVIDFTSNMVDHGNLSILVPFEGLGHGFFNYGNMDNQPYLQTIREMEKFLKGMDFLDEE